MIKTLMHKDTPVAKLQISSLGAVEQIIELYNEELLPERNGKTLEDFTIATQHWMLLRKLITGREDIYPIYCFYGGNMFQSGNMRSLADTYWLQVSPNETWENVNAFDNFDPVEDDIFLALYFPKMFEGPRFDSPNLTLSGRIPRVWFVDETHPLGILRSDAQIAMREYNTAVANKLDIVKPKSYFILSETVFTYERCNTSKDIEQIPFESLYNRTKDYNLSEMENIQKCCETFKIPKWKSFFNQLLEFKAITNTPLEIYDIKVLRNTDDLQILGFDKL